MSKQTQLPPRCPLQNKGLPSRVIDSGSSPRHGNTGLCGRHRRSPSQSAVMEEQPSWLDDLLSDTGSNSKGALHRRSASDSVAFLVDPFMIPRLISLGEEGNRICSEPQFWSNGSVGPNQSDCKDGSSSPLEFASLLTKQPKCSDASSELEATFIYGPNSPRLRSNLTHPEGSIARSLCEEYVPQNRAFQYLEDSLHSFSAESHATEKGDGNSAFGDLEHELKGAKRHSGQRSRVRKLQYIAELERTVNAFETIESELSAKAAALFQQRAILTVENTTLKQQMASLLQEKMIKDGQYQSLKIEVEKLKMARVHQPKSRSNSRFPIYPTELAIPETSWQMLDMGKLNLSGNSVTLKHGSRS